ncbi:MAG: hypothetical protein GXP62_15555 [Oligoflexia bacterium]|nr:hypothetical protein [Oligoflexia bacterium]
MKGIVTTLSLMALMASAPASAAPSMSAGEGLFTVPQAETVAPNQMNLAVGIYGVGTPQTLRLGGFPFGAAVGINQQLSVGFHMEPVDYSLRDSPFSTASLSARMRVVDPVDDHPAVAVQAELGRFGQDPTAELIGVIGKDLGRVAPVAFAGLRWHKRGSFGATLGAGASIDLVGPTQAIVEASMMPDTRGIADWQARGGVRGLLGPLMLGGWLGGGFFEAVPWAGAGIVLAMTSVDIRSADRDLDGVADINDACIYVAEDLDQWQDDDGCPDVDNDGDGILDADDPTPNGEEVAEEQGLLFTTPTPRLRLRMPQLTLPSTDAAAEPRRGSAEPPEGTQ